MYDRKEVMSWLEGLTDEDWQRYHSDSEVRTIAKAALEMLKERQGKGRWIEYPECLGYDGAIDDTYIACSECGHVFCIMDNCTEEFDFCPHCGADMRGTSDGERQDEDD